MKSQSERLADNRIETVIKVIYDEIAREPVPDKFLDLLRQLDAAEERKQTRG